VDATAPFGGGHFLPRGLLRESPRALARADVIVLTRTDAVGADALATLRARVEALAPRAEVALACTRATGLVAPDGTRRPLATLAGAAVVAWSGIGNPAAFERTLEAAGARSRAPPCADHHRPTPAAVAAVLADAAPPPERGRRRDPQGPREAPGPAPSAPGSWPSTSRPTPGDARPCCGGGGRARAGPLIGASRRAVRSDGRRRRGRRPRRARACGPCAPGAAGTGSRRS
jgi:hypothetical protein